MYCENKSIFMNVSMKKVSHELGNINELHIRRKDEDSFKSFGFQITWGFGPAIKVLEIEPKSHAELVGLHKGDILPEEVCRENDYKQLLCCICNNFLCTPCKLWIIFQINCN